jgi:hypothetical protein
VLTGFGSFSGQALRQFQLRGEGTSGPYLVDQRLIPGTDQVIVEIRDRDNAERVVGRRYLSAFIDYQIDYRSGTILLKQPLAASDPYGNPIFLLVTAESNGGGDREGIFGARLQHDVGMRPGGTPGPVQFGGSVVHDGQGANSLNLLAADVRLTPLTGTELVGEVAHSAFGDTTGLATHLSARASLFADRIALNGGWRRVESTFRNPSHIATQGGSEEINLGGAVRLLSGELRLEHARQDFDQIGIGRSRSSVTLRQPLLFRTELEARVMDEEITGGPLPRQGSAGDLKLTWRPVQRLSVWGEGRTRLAADEGTPGASEYVGAGLSFDLTQQISAEARHLSVENPDGTTYALTNLGVRSQLAGGTRAWGSYQIVGGIDNAAGAALVGLNQTLRFGGGWTANGLFERRSGLDRAPLDDPLRGLPFTQREDDYWSGGLGLEYLPAEAPYRVSIKGERKEGNLERFNLGTVAGDIALGGSFALLGRQEYMLREAGPEALAGFGRMSRRASILGLALRPEATQTINALVELRWLDEENPRGAGLMQGGRDDERLIAATELIWSPAKLLELGGRYAVRSMRTRIDLPELEGAESYSRANYLGVRGDLNFSRWLGVRSEARLLDELRSNTRTWDFAPSLLVHAIEGMELSAGYRFGELQDIDFAVNGGSGFFVTLGARVTERTLPTTAAFWRHRFTR